MADGMMAPDLGLDPFSSGALESGAASAPQTQDAGAAGQAAGTGVAPGADQGAGAATGVAGEAGAMPGAEVRMVPATDLDQLRSTYDRQLAQTREQYVAQQRQNMQLAEALWQLQTANLSPEQRREADAARAFQNQLEGVLQAATAQQTQMTNLEPVFKKMAVDELVSQYGYAGVKREYLNRFNDPDAMEAACLIFADQHKAAQAQARVPANQAAAGASGAPPSRNFAKMDMAELAALAFS